MNIALMTGQLQINSPDPDLLQQLTGYSSRVNKKRGFIFISKVLGKYMPCLPDEMTKMHQQLASKIQTRLIDHEKTVVIGFAETATALGFGVYQQLDLKQSLYLHTSRYPLNQPLLVAFREEHSHAPEQLLYQPQDPILRQRLQQAHTIILIDDEFSTGNTLKNIIKQLRIALPQAQRFIAGALLNWIPSPLKDVETIALHQGSYSFEEKPIKTPALGRANNPNAPALDTYIPYNFGRFGIEQLQLNLSQYIDAKRYKNKQVLVLGTGEFMYPAYQLALYLQQHQVKTWVQSSGRSPINIDHSIKNRLQFKDNYFESIDNFIYNIKAYDVIIICYETPVLPKNHRLKHLLQAYAPEVIEIMLEHQ